MNFSEEGLREAAKGIERIYETVERVNRVRASSDTVAADPGLLAAFKQEMDDDFNTPKAVALIFEEIRSLNRMMDQGEAKGLYPRGLALKAMGDILGLLEEDAERFLRRKRERWIEKRGLSREWIDDLIQRRQKARGEKRWHEADRIRQELQEKGIALEDTPDGTVWKVR